MMCGVIYIMSYMLRVQSLKGLSFRVLRARYLYLWRRPKVRNLSADHCDHTCVVSDQFVEMEIGQQSRHNSHGIKIECLLFYQESKTSVGGFPLDLKTTVSLHTTAWPDRGPPRDGTHKSQPGSHSAGTHGPRPDSRHVV